MKKFKVISVVVICFLFVSVSVNATGFRTNFKNYEIEAVDNLNLGKDIEAVWTLTYNESEKPVTVVKRSTIEGTVYVVNNPFFEVCYASTTKGFGAKTVKKSWSSVPRQICSVVLNTEQLKRQEIITPNKVDDEKALGLIASYLPNLLNDDYTHLLN